MFRSAKAPPWCTAILLAMLASASPALANLSLPTSNIDWAYIASTNTIRFHMRFLNTDPTPTPPATGVLNPQLYGAFMPDAGPARPFDVPAVQANGFFDVFTDFALQSLPPSAGTVGTQPTGSPCAPPNGWNGNVDITWSGPNGSGRALRHMGQILICPGAPCAFIHVVTNCAASAPWTLSGLCPGFHATLFEEDRVTPAPDPVPPAWHGWLCMTADASVPIPTTCCVQLTFSCAGQPGIVELCATTCQCRTPANPVPGTIEWETLPDNATVRFHVQWQNPDSLPSGQIDGQMNSQMFGVFQPDYGPIGAFSVPALPSHGFFDVFTDIALSQLPPLPTKPGGPPPAGPCPPDKHWDGNVDLTWHGAAGGATINKHIGHLVVCPGSGASLIHVGFLSCGSPTGEPWSITGLCSGFSATLVNADSTTPAPNPVPPGWSGYISVTATAATPVPDTCCFKVTFVCNGVPGVIDLCAMTCNCNPNGSNPQPGAVDWATLPGTNTVRFHIRWNNPSASLQSLPVSGDMKSQAFGVFLPDAGGIGHFDIPAIAPGSFFDVFFNADKSSLPAPPAKQLPGGGPPVGGPCPPDDHWDGNVDITWNGPGGSGTVNRHYGTLTLNSAGGSSYLHVISGCTLATGSTWTISGLCPGFTALLENEDHSPAPAVLPAGWTGWLRMMAPGLPVGSSCCVTLTIQCGLETAAIQVCAVTCSWATLAVEPDDARVSFGIHGIVPNPTGGPARIGFALSRAGLAKLEVFDAAGQRVRTLADGGFTAGLHSVVWDGRDGHGNLARPGAYFVRLSAGAQSSAHMLVLRP